MLFNQIDIEERRTQLNYITDFLCFDKNDDLEELKTEVKDDVRYIHVIKKLKPV